MRNTSRNREAAAAIQAKKRVKVVWAPFCLLTDGGLKGLGIRYRTGLIKTGLNPFRIEAREIIPHH